MQCVIIAGGRGTRLKEFLGDLPKPMVEIGGRPLIEHQIVLARHHGFDRILLLTGYGAEALESHLGDGSRFGVRIHYQPEPEPLGTAGALIHAFHLLDDRFLVMYGDTMLNVDLARMWNAHPADADVTLLVHPNSHPSDSDLVEVDNSNQVTAIHPYPHPEGVYYRNLVNAALYVCSKEPLRTWRAKQDELSYPLDFGKHVFPEMLQTERNLHAYISREYIRDAGTPKRLLEVREHFETGRIARGSLDTPVPAIFLDRDGTLNYERNWLSDARDLELMPTVAEAVRLINESGLLAVVITNQPVVARGDCDEANLRLIHNKLEWLLGLEHAYLDAIYYCPHHPHKGFPGERPELKIDCTCRKPGTALFTQAASDLNIDLSRSVMIGDRIGDIQAAKALGMGSVLVKSGMHLELTNPSGADAEVDTLLEAVKNFVGQPIRLRGAFSPVY